jgi:hypothetical protein
LWAVRVLIALATDNAPMPGGRPTDYNEEIACRICELVATNPYGLEIICADYPELPSPQTISRWQTLHPEFREAFTCAREGRADVLLDQSLQIADDGNEDYRLELRRGGEVVAVVDQEAIGRSRLRVETRLKMIEKLAPKKYGNKLGIEHSGSIGLVDSSDEELVAEIMELVATGHLILPAGAEIAQEPQAEDDWADLV